MKRLTPDCVEEFTTGYYSSSSAVAAIQTAPTEQDGANGMNHRDIQELLQWVESFCNGSPFESSGDEQVELFLADAEGGWVN